MESVTMQVMQGILKKEESTVDRQIVVYFTVAITISVLYVQELGTFVSTPAISSHFYLLL